MKIRVGNKNIDVPFNILDRFTAWRDPVKGGQRLNARLQIEMSKGGYSGANRTRRSMSGWSTSSSDADGAVLLDLQTLRDRSRDLVRNNSLVAGARKTKVANIVGTGLQLNSRIDADYLGLDENAAAEWQRNTEREFNLWANSKDCDIERTLTFKGLQRLAFLSTFESGDVFVSMPYVARGNTYDLALQLIEADRVCNADWQADTDNLSGGVERDQFGGPTKYHVLRGHPGAVGRHSKSLTWDKLDAFGRDTNRRNILHLYDKERIGLSRGVPELAPVIESLRQLGDYTDAELTAAAVSSMFTVFVKTETGQGLGLMGGSDTGGKSSDEDIKLSAGAVVDLAQGEDVTFANPSRPNPAYDPFVMAILRQIGVALELPFELLIMHFTSSYSASRAAILQAWKFFRMRREWLVENLCFPVYEEWLFEAVALGRVVAPGFLNDPAIRAAYCKSEWTGPSMGQIDPNKEAQANEIMEDRGWKTATEITSEMTGGDWETKHRQRVREQQLRSEAGLNTKPSKEGFFNGDEKKQEEEDE